MRELTESEKAIEASIMKYLRIAKRAGLDHQKVLAKVNANFMFCSCNDPYHIDGKQFGQDLFELGDEYNQQRSVQGF